MLNKSMKRKALALLVTGGALFQFGFGGCTQLALKEVVVGMGRSLGAIPANLVDELFLAPLIEGITNPEDGEE